MFEREPGYNPERALWQSVLLLAIEEALNGVKGNLTRKTRERLTEEAQIYLTTESDDLALACSGAGIDMKALIERMSGRIPNVLEPKIGKQGVGSDGERKSGTKPRICA